MAPSIFFMVLILIIFFLFAQIKINRRWANLGMGLGFGILLHILLDNSHPRNNLEHPSFVRQIRVFVISSWMAVIY